MKPAAQPAEPEPVASTSAAPDADTAWRLLHSKACQPYRKAGRWAWYWARGKLSRDPVFRGMLERGHLPARARVVDIGCGQGLVASLLHAARSAARRGLWPAEWPPAPSAVAYTGIELIEKETRRASRALGLLPFMPRFVHADMRQAELPPCDVVVILDVLHYVDHKAQRAVLGRVRNALVPGGRLLLRVGDAGETHGYRASQWVDRVVTLVRGHRAPPTHGRPLGEWKALLWRLGFAVEAVPMSHGTPFANVLLVGTLQQKKKSSA
jgi:SAM-dependent methyltransferase